MITAALALQIVDRTVLEWSWTEGVVRHDGTTYPFQAGRHVTTDPDDQGPLVDVNEGLTVAGTDAVAGTWEIELKEITYRTSDGERVQLSGPVTISVTVP